MIVSIEHSKTHSKYKYNKHIQQYITINDHLKELLTVNNADIESLCSHPAAKSDLADHSVSDYFIKWY